MFDVTHAEMLELWIQEREHELFQAYLRKEISFAEQLHGLHNLTTYRLIAMRALRDEWRNKKAA